MTSLVLLRHGRTDWNAEGRFQGQSQSQLDERGRAQAAAVAPVLADFAPSLLWSSDADRTRATTAYVAAACALTPVFDARLREYHFGALEGLLRAEFEAADPAGYRSFLAWDWDAVPAIEKYAAVADRVTSALLEVAAEVGSGTAVVVSHGAAIRTAVATLLGWGPEQALALRGMDNCGYTVVRRAPGSDRWRLEAYNRVVPTPDFTEPESVG